MKFLKFAIVAAVVLCVGGSRAVLADDNNAKEEIVLGDAVSVDDDPNAGDKDPDAADADEKDEDIVKAQQKEDEEEKAAAAAKPAAEAKPAAKTKPARALTRAEQVLYYVNIERKKRGKKPLKISDRCQRKAEARAKAICRRFSHKGAFGGLGCYRWKGENIARGQRSPRSVVRAWMRSKGHRKNMMSGKFDYMGLGYCKGRWVQTLGGGKTRVWGKNKPKKIIHRRPRKKIVKKRR